MSVLETLRERGFVQQCTNEPDLAKLFEKTKVIFYAGFDPTAESLHCGSLMPIMAMAHLQKAGHSPIAIIGGGTAMVGDPSGKTELRKMLTKEEIEHNGAGILEQLRRYLTLDGQQGKFLNNADWLLGLGYIDFLRDVGVHFRINEMIKAEAYRLRLEREEGLSFIEFNYQLLQAYDFLLLNQKHGCLLQIGGDDQWSNILAGADLVRKIERKTAYGLTFPLLTTARGEKMGKTAAGAIWLSAARTKPYDFYQYWINVDDRDVQRFLAYFTFLPMDEVRRLGALQGADLREAKSTLAFEVTALCHGKEEAESARKAAQEAFSGGGDLSGIPTTTLPRSEFEAGVSVLDLFTRTGLAESKKAVRRLIEQGGAVINDNPVTSADLVIKADGLKDGALILRSGKKKFHRVIAE